MKSQTNINSIAAQPKETNERQSEKEGKQQIIKKKPQSRASTARLAAERNRISEPTWHSSLSLAPSELGDMSATIQSYAGCKAMREIRMAPETRSAWPGPSWCSGKAVLGLRAACYR
jgi:hypothetical protein